ncbi:MAG: hypothetical protein PF961_05595 [Planctomycetota bacterium]|jgi:hypothetical protein|nr:hypothetical protein [Planctomycetota bacterium]
MLRTAALLCSLLALLAGADLPTPSAWRQQVMANPNLATSSGEAWCWHFAHAADTFIDGYRASGDPAWLQVAKEHYDWAIETAISNDPDGFPGTFGGPFSNNKPGAAPIIHDTVVGDALLARPLTSWAAIVLADKELSARWGTAATLYLDIAKRMCFDKINHRSMYLRDRLDYGSYHTYPQAIDVATGSWVDSGTIISDNLNKHYTNATVLLRLWRITGDDALRQRAAEIFARHTAMRRGFDDNTRAVWNFWMPHGAYDMPGNAPASWVAVHPKRPGYQAGEVACFVEAYDSGVVFSRHDIELMCATNRWMQSHTFTSADGSSKAGTLWTALARFDPQLHKATHERLAAAKGDRGRIQRATFALDAPTSDDWARRLLPPGHQAQATTLPMQPGMHLSMAMVIPDTVLLRSDRRVRLATALVGTGRLEIEVLDQDGTPLARLFEREITPGTSYLAPLWDGSLGENGERKPGAYQIRWTFGGEQRSWPVWVEPGDEAAASDVVPELEPGQTWHADLAQRTAPRWTESKTELVSEKGRDQVLAITKRAVVRFAHNDNRKVLVRAQIYDAGTTRGKNNGTGIGLGLMTADGDIFAIRQAWRPYLNGDRDYAWFNTGENQWFTSHPLGLKRKTAWREWVFDCTGDQLRITCDGHAVPAAKLQPAKHVPSAAVGVVFLGGAGEALYLSGLSVTRPANLPETPLP